MKDRRRTRPALAILALALAPAASAAAPPRLLMSYPADGRAYGLEISPITLVFSQPMDPASIVIPNHTNSNPDRSFEAWTVGYNNKLVPWFLGWQTPIALEGGRIIIVPGSSVVPGATLHLFAHGIRSLSGERLDRDYDVTNLSCAGCISGLQDTLHASLPADGQANADPVAPISIYTGPPDLTPEVDQPLLHLRLGLTGPEVLPLTFRWDPPVYGLARYPKAAMMQVTIDHPPLAASALPYRLYFDSGTPPGNPRNFIPFLSFTVGPAVAGDLNGNGAVDVGDAVLVFRGALGFLKLTDAQTFVADLVPTEGANGRPIGDGTVDVADATYILRRAVGLVPDDQWP